MLRDVIHRREGIHVSNVGIQSLVDELGIEHRKAAIHQQHETDIVLCKSHPEDDVVPSLHLIN